jgi:capsular exopolysaccharide synthesis family protein
VDCDLRRPTIHKNFGFKNVPGLSDYLTNGRQLPDLLLNTRIDKLTILPAGKPPANPAELLSSEKMSALIDEVTHRYSDRLIIIDSPPPKITSESSFLARQVDGILIVIKYGKTRRKDVETLVAMMGKNKILGSIINHFSVELAGYFSYRKYSNYGQYY